MRNILYTRAVAARALLVVTLALGSGALSLGVRSATAATPGLIQLAPPSADGAATVAPPPTAVDPRAEQLAARLRERVTALRAETVKKAAAVPLSHAQAATLTALRERLKAAVEVRLRPVTGTPMQIAGAVLEPAVAGFAAGPARDEQTARAFLRTNRELLRLEDPDAELVLERRAVDHLGRCHLRFSQQHRDIPVWPGGLIVHLNANGHVDILDGAFVPTPKKVLPALVVGADTALAHARAAVAGGAAARAGMPRLILYAPGATPPQLAWKIELTVSHEVRWLVVIDAVNGDTLTAYNQVMEAGVPGSGPDLFGATRALNVFDDGGTFYMIDTSKPMYDPTSQPPDLDQTRGAIFILDARNQIPDSEGRISLFHVTSGSATSGWLPDAVSASYGLSRTHDYFRERHNRNSLDGQGGGMIGVVRFNQGLANAFWNGTLMAFGDAQPFAGALDIVGHELTHGVTQYSANLVYQNQSGALNEAFSDVFGESVEAFESGGNPDWLMGSRLSPPLRNMMNPSAIEICPGCGRNFPSRMSEFIQPDDPFLNQFRDRDNGGVHINSGIINRAYYLLAQGLDGAIGIRDAERIFYRALTTHLVSSSQFIDARLACIRSAEELEQAGQVSPQASEKTAEAFSAVEISDAAPPPPPPPPPTVSGPDATLFLRRTQGSFLLGRREEAQGDDAAGVRLANTPLDDARPSVAGDGSFAAFVSADNDLCLIETDGTEEECLGHPAGAQVGAVSVSRDGLLFGVVLLDAFGGRDNRISILDLHPGQEPRTFTLVAPEVDGESINTIQYADSMDFSSDGRLLFYDAFNLVTLDGVTQFGAWSIYALDSQTGVTQVVVPPTRGFDVEFPMLSQTSDNFITFDSVNQSTGQSTVTACNRTTRACTPVATVAVAGVPGYTGDDSAIVYSKEDAGVPSGYSLWRQPLMADRVTPNGAPTLWLSDADFSAIYRRLTAASIRGMLENPGPGSPQSGIGLISGWLCEAFLLEIQVDDGPPTPAAYGTSRGDTQGACGDANNGFGLLTNWNLFGAGTHTVHALADGVEFASATFTVTTPGVEFLPGASGLYRLLDFPRAGTNVLVRWVEGLQNFVITGVENGLALLPAATPTGGGRRAERLNPPPVVGAHAVPHGILENPGPDSSQSGIGLISGWLCSGSRIEIQVDNNAATPAAYGTTRGDTQGACGDANNGFGLLTNWNLFGDGPHTVRALADGVEFGRATFTVTTLGQEFVPGVSGSYTLPDFPAPGRSVVIEWVEALQNFTIVEFR